MAELTQLLKVDEFAAALGVRPSCIRRWILERRISSVKVGRLVRIPALEIERMINEGLRTYQKRVHSRSRHEMDESNV
jgi:excisionase family DNA binding protein